MRLKDYVFENCNDDDWREMEETDEGQENVKVLNEKIQENKC